MSSDTPEMPEKIDVEPQFAEDWFYADYFGGDRLEGTEAPTHFTPLPELNEED